MIVVLLQILPMQTASDLKKQKKATRVRCLDFVFVYLLFFVAEIDVAKSICFGFN